MPNKRDNVYRKTPTGVYPGRDRVATQPPPGDWRARVTFSLITGVLLRLAVIAAIGYLVYRARFILTTVLIAAILSLAVSPAVDRISRWPGLWGSRRVRKTIATTIVFVLIGIALWLAYELLVAPFHADVKSLGIWITHEAARWEVHLAKVREWMNTLPPEAQKVLNTQDYSNVTQWATRFVTGIAVTSVQWITHIVDLILIPVLAFYFLVEGRGLKREFIGLIPPKRRRRPLLILRLTGRILRDYTIAQILLCIIAGIVVYVGLRALGVNYALSLAVLAGVTRAIPIIGPIIGGIPIVLLTASQSLSLGIAVLIFFSALHLVESKVLLPKLVGVRLHIHAALVLIVLLLGGEFAGLFGMFLAAPVAAMIRVLLRMYVVKPGATHI